MQQLIERSLADGRRVANIIFGPLDQAGGQLDFVDVGARNGSFLLPASYTSRTRITGFEPNPEEYGKLASGSTDAKALGITEPPFKSRRYFPDAVWSGSGDQKIYITIGPGAASLMGPADEVMTSNMFLDGSGGKNYLDQHQKLMSVESINCVTLDAIWPESDGLIDVLKLDVEGGELEVLKGAQRILSKRRALLVYSEFMFVPYYTERVTLGHQQVFLDDFGYRLIGMNLDHGRYSWKQSGIQPQNDNGLIYAGDAVFIVDPDRNALSTDEMYRLGLACLAMGFAALGLNLIREAGQVSAADIAAIEQEANRISTGRKLRMAWEDFPNHVYRLLRTLKLRG